MKEKKYLYKNCPYEDYGFSSCRVCPNFEKCSKRKEKQIKQRKVRNEADEFRNFVMKIEMFLVCILILSMILGNLATIKSLAKEHSGKKECSSAETTQTSELVDDVDRKPMDEEETKDVQDEIEIVITPEVITTLAEVEPEFFEGIEVVEWMVANAFGPCSDWIYNISEEDMIYIARVVWAEARGECLEGKVAVAAVVLNRFVSGKGEFHTESIYRVVTQSGAFASIAEVDESDLAEYPDCMRAVRLACRGWDPTRETFESGALYFFNPENVEGYQARIREGIVVHTIGKHDFHVDFNWDEVIG